jgi:phosphatidylserine decarboxylase
LIRLPVAKEGLIFILPSLGLSFLCYYKGFPISGTFVFFLTLFFCYFFRNPQRTAENREGELISPADGRVIAVEELYEPRFLKGKVMRISVFMSVADVHVNRAPCDGTIETVRHEDGAFKLAFKKGIDDENERNYILVRKDDEGFLIVQIAGFLARRVISYVSEHDNVEKCAPVGMIAFGSRVDLYAPLAYEPMVTAGQKVKSGLTVLAKRKGDRS